MLKYQTHGFDIYLFTENNKLFGFIRHEPDNGFWFTPNFTSKAARNALSIPGMIKKRYFHNLEACKYYSLAMFLEYGAE